ncbi:MAG: terminase [Desulfobacteraceae bacterium]|nr:terminase [Desulfobacteraceae bacterium]
MMSKKASPHNQEAYDVGSVVSQNLTPDEQLALDMGRFYADPYGFVMYAYPWGEEGTPLENFKGPDKWQKDKLIWLGQEIKKRNFNGVDPVDPIRDATSSGHGIGKSALTAWLVDFIMSTRPYCKGTVTANTSPQLETKTWAQLAYWTELCITSHWFQINTGKGNMRMWRKGHKSSWYCSGQTCKKENAESFAGQHAINSTSFYIFDEASAIEDIIWDVADGGLTDGEPMFFVFGNPTKNVGKFKECFTKRRNRWHTKKIDSRTCKFPNKKYIQELVDDYGEDSDYVRIRVKGEFPRSGAKQYIGNDLVDMAAGKVIHPSGWMDRAKILGVDCAREGDDKTVFVRRQGPAVFGLKKFVKLNIQSLAGRIAEEIRTWKPDMVFIDFGGGGSEAYDLLKEWGFEEYITLVNFGSAADNDALYFNKRMEMWGRLKKALENGLAIPQDSELYDDLIGPQYGFSSKEQFQLERKQDMKSRGVASPDCGDAVALTYAYHVEKRKYHKFNTDDNSAKTEYKLFDDNQPSPQDRGDAKTDYDIFGCADDYLIEAAA